MLKIIKNYPVWILSFVISILVSVYWINIATNRYVSQAHIVLLTPEVAPPEFSMSTIFTGGGGNKADLLLLRDYLMSVDMLKILDEDLDLRKHFSNIEIDYFSRMPEKDLAIENFHEFYLDHVEIELDDYSGVLVIKSSVFTPSKAKEITELLISAGEKFMNQMGQRLAEDQVKFITEQVENLRLNLEKTQQDVLDYQNSHQLISPTETVESYSQIIAELRTDLAKLNSKKIMLSDFQGKKSAEMIKIDSEISALKKQIEIENSKLIATKGTALNKISAEYEALLLKAKFAQELYSNAIATLESTRVEAARKLKQVSVTQTATVPEYSTEPHRIYNIVVTILMLFVLSVILSMIYEILLDHRD